MRRIFSLLFFASAWAAFSQPRTDTLSVAKGLVPVISDPRLDLLLQRHIAGSESNHKIRGYRVQLASGMERKVVMDMKARVLSRYPDLKIYVLYQQPYFKLRTGNYRTIWEAKGAQK